MHKAILMIALAVPGALVAQETRDLGAHEHGHAALNIAVEGTQVAMAFEAPGADIVGFEYKAETAGDRAKVDAAIAELSKPLSLFVLPAAAGCTVVSSTAALHDEHHEEGEERAEHTEFQAEYLLNCTDPSAIDRIGFPIFETFPNAEEVEIQMISDKGSQGFEVKRDSPVLDLSGLI